MTGGISAGVLDEFGNQLNPNITGNGAISLKASGVDLVAERQIRGETMTLGDYLYGFPLFFAWQTQPSPLRALSSLQAVVDRAWANPDDPMSALTIAIFNRGRSLLFQAPRLSLETPLNAIQAYLMTSTLFAWANADIYYMDGLDTPPPAVLIGTREKARTLLASYFQAEVASDAPLLQLAANGPTAPTAAASADRTNIVLVPGANSNNKEVTVTLQGTNSFAVSPATIVKYQWRPLSSSDPTPPDGSDPTATVKFTSGAHHTYRLYVTDSNGLQGSALVTIEISGDCDFMTHTDQSAYPWCSTFKDYLKGVALKTTIPGVGGPIDVVSKYVGDIAKTVEMCKTVGPVINSTAAFQATAGKSVVGFFAGSSSDLVQKLNTMVDNGQFKAVYDDSLANAKKLNQLQGFTTSAAGIIKDQLGSFVGTVAKQLFSYLIDKMTDQIIDGSRPSPPFLRSAELVPSGQSAVSQTVLLTFMPSGDEKSDVAKASAGSLNGIRKYSYAIYRQTGSSGGPQRIDIMPGSQLYPGGQAPGSLPDYTWVDTDPQPGTNVYYVGARVIRTDQVPNSVDTTTQRMLMDYMLGLIPGGSVMGGALWQSLDITDKVMRGLFLQDSDRSDPEHIYVGDLTQNLHPDLDLAVDKKSGTAYLSIPSTSGIFKVVPGGIDLFVDAGFKTPFQGGLAADSRGNLYCDNKASDDNYGGRIFSFQAGTGARQLVGSTTYYSQMLAYARPANVATLAYGADSQGECLYIADAFDKTVKRLALNSANPPDHNVGQIYAQSSDLNFQSTTKMASDLFGTLFLTQGPDLMQIMSAPGGGAVVSKAFPPGQSPFTLMTGVDFDLMGNIYLADVGSGTVTMVPPPYANFMLQDASYRKRFVVMSGLNVPLDLKLSADGRGYLVVDSEGIHKKNFGFAGRIWDQAANAPLDGATLLVDEALAPGKTDIEGFFSLSDISVPSGPQDVKLKVVASDGRSQLIPGIHLNAYGHTALLQDLIFNPPTMPTLPPIPPDDPSVTVDPDPLPIEAPQFQTAAGSLGQTQTRHFVVPERRIFPTASPTPPPLPPPSSVAATLSFAPAPPDPPTGAAPSAPSIVQPVVSIVAPADGMLTRAGVVTVSGMVQSNQNIPAVTLTVNGVDLQVAVSNGIFSGNVTLNDGLNIISARGGSVGSDPVNKITFLEGRSVPVKVQKSAAVSPSLDFSGVVVRADGVGYRPYVDMIVTLYGIVDAASGQYRILGSTSTRGDGVYQFHLENGTAASAGVQSLFQQLGNGATVPMKIVVSDPRS
jgi:hypothetical protein